MQLVNELINLPTVGESVGGICCVFHIWYCIISPERLGRHGADEIAFYLCCVWLDGRGKQTTNNSIDIKPCRRNTAKSYLEADR